MPGPVSPGALLKLTRFAANSRQHEALTRSLVQSSRGFKTARPLSVRAERGSQQRDPDPTSGATGNPPAGRHDNDRDQGGRQVARSRRQDRAPALRGRGDRDRDLSPFSLDMAPFFSLRGSRDIFDTMEDLMFAPSRMFQRQMRDILQQALAPLEDIDEVLQRPTVEANEDDKAIYFKVNLPGLKKDEVKVRVEGDNLLTIEGKKEEGSDEEGKERHWEAFNFRFRLPDEVDVQNIKAETKDDGLHITVPKREQKVHNIPILDAGGQDKGKEIPAH